MTKIYQTLLLLWGVLASHLVAAQTLPQKPFNRCGTEAPTKEYLAANPEVKARMEAIEKQTQQYIRDAAATSGKEAPGAQAKPLLTIPVVVHIVYNNAIQNVSDAVVQAQIDELNLGFRKLSPDVAQVPAPFAPFVADVRVNFCLATRDPSGNYTTGITRRSTSVTAFSYDADNVKSAATGGTDAWNTTQYLNIWVCNVQNYAGYGVFPGTYPAGNGRDGIVLSYFAFGRGHAGLYREYTLGRTAIHEVGHWLDLRHIWGDDLCGDDGVNDTPPQAELNRGNPTFPRLSGCQGSGPAGDMFMNHMDYVDDDSKLMFSTEQAQRMQAIVAPNGFRAGLLTSPGLIPTLSIASTGAIPSVLFCGDRTEYRLRAEPSSAGCGGGTLRYEWAATNGWTVSGSNWYSPTVTPSGTSGSTITLTGTYINTNGVSIPLNTASVSIGYDARAGTPVFTSGPAMLCSGQPATFTVAAVPGATSYLWGPLGGFTAPGQIITSGGGTTTTTPSLTLIPDASLNRGRYAVMCQALVAGGCLPSATSTRSFDVNGGVRFAIVDAIASQRYMGMVCRQNYIYLRVVPTTSSNGTATNIRWLGGGIVTPEPNLPGVFRCMTPAVASSQFTISATYTDDCQTPGLSAFSYVATTIPSGTTDLGNGYSCRTNQYRSVPQVPYPNPATGSLQLPGYQGQVVIYNQQGKPVQTLLAPGTDYGAAVNVSAWPEGLYVVTGRGLTGEFLRHNVQIQH